MYNMDRGGVLLRSFYSSDRDPLVCMYVVLPVISVIVAKMWYGMKLQSRLRCEYVQEPERHPPRNPTH